jgi:hypothetical protein
MALKVWDRTMTSERTVHAARLTDGDWLVLAAWPVLGRDPAVMAMTLAEAMGQGIVPLDVPRRPRSAVQGLTRAAAWIVVKAVGISDDPRWLQSTPEPYASVSWMRRSAVSTSMRPRPAALRTAST